MNGKSGKLVAPAVAFMLCAVALIGVGFAAVSLNSTSTANGNEVLNVDGLVLNLTGDGEGTTVITGAAAVYYQTVQESANGSIEYYFAQGDMKIAAGKVNIESPGNVTLTYTVKNVKVKLSDNSDATVATPVLKMGSTETQGVEGVYTFSNTNVAPGEHDFVIFMYVASPTLIDGASTTTPPAKITFDLSVSATYSVPE